MTQRDRLLARVRPSLPYRLLVADGDTVEAARAALLQAQTVARQITLRGKPNSASVRRIHKAVAEAEAAVDACYETIVFRALPPATVEQMIAAHPPTEAQMAKAKQARDRAAQRGEDLPGWPDWDEDTFRPALLAACCDNGMTEADWAAFLASNVSNGEKVGIWRTVIAVNERERVADPLVLPKGLMEILSSR